MTGNHVWMDSEGTPLGDRDGVYLYWVETKDSVIYHTECEDKEHNSESRHWIVDCPSGGPKCKANIGGILDNDDILELGRGYPD
jgi:hypothetical protein